MAVFRGMTLACCLSAALPATAQEIPNPYSEYYGVVERVIDGDTVQVRIDLWPGLEAVYAVRVRNIDAPELRGAKCPQEKLWAEAASKQAEKLYPVGTVIRLENVELDSFGRAVGDVRRWVSDRWLFFADEMTERDMAQIWEPGMDDLDWCNVEANF